MSKRTATESAKKNPKDFWPTPYRAVVPLVPHLTPLDVFVEPCAADGQLVRHLLRHLQVCLSAFDIIPRGGGVQWGDAATAEYDRNVQVITNPPFRRSLLEPLLDRWIGFVPCWLLLPSDYAINIWTNPYMRYVDKIVPIGRVSWMNNGVGGMENYAWFHFSLDRVGLISERK